MLNSLNKNEALFMSQMLYWEFNEDKMFVFLVPVAFQNVYILIPRIYGNIMLHGEKELRLQME